MTDATRRLGPGHGGGGFALAAVERGAQAAHRRRELPVGDSVSAVARRHGVHASVLFKWRRRQGKPTDSGAGFVPVVVETGEVASEAPTGRMEIVLGDDVRVVVDATVYAPALPRVRAVVRPR